jgi:hypothetical protein
MRRLLLAALICSALAAITPPSGGGKLPPIRAVCTGGAGLDVYFWPHGHSAVPALGFPAFAAPHVELYQSRDVAGSAQLAYLARNQYQLMRTCSSAGMEYAAPAVESAVTSTSERKIRCAFAGNVDVRLNALWRTTTRVVKRPVLVRVNGRMHRKLVPKRTRITELLGTRATARAAGSGATILSVEVAKTPRVTWDSRACAPVALTD